MNKIAFSTVACPDWTLHEVAERGAEMGFAGVELRTLGTGSALLASDPALTDPGKVADILKAFGMSPVCLSTSISLHVRGETAIFNAQQAVRRELERAAAIGAPALRVFVNKIYPGEDRPTTLRRVTRTAESLAEAAGELGVELLFENSGSLGGGKAWWWLFNMIDHPMVGLAFNVANAAAADEADGGGAVTIPMMSSRIRLAKLKDTRVGEGVGWTALGEGTVGVEAATRRLLGVGYAGWLSLEWDRLWLPGLEPAETYLPAAREALEGWLVAAAEGREKAGKKAGEQGKWPRVVEPSSPPPAPEAEPSEA